MSFERGELVWLNFSPNKRDKQASRRPALVISPRSYNETSNTMLVCPITSNVAPWPWKVELAKPYNGISGAVLVDQLKSIDPRARAVERAGQSISRSEFTEIIARLLTLTS